MLLRKLVLTLLLGIPLAGFVYLLVMIAWSIFNPPPPLIYGATGSSTGDATAGIVACLIVAIMFLLVYAGIGRKDIK
jgi:hypothetical protein